MRLINNIFQVLTFENNHIVQSQKKVLTIQSL